MKGYAKENNKIYKKQSHTKITESKSESEDSEAEGKIKKDLTKPDPKKKSKYDDISSLTETESSDDNIDYSELTKNM